jgi:hypothetical protein
MSASSVPTTSYAYRPDALLRLKQRRKRILAPVLVMMMTLIIALSLVMFAPGSGSFRNLFALVTFFSIAVAYIALATTRTIMERTQRAWSNYRLVVDESGIQRIQNETPEFRLDFADVETVEETQGVGIRLNPGNSLRSVFIPEAIEHYSELRQWVLDRTKAPVRLRRFIWLPFIIGAVCGGIILNFVLTSLDVGWVLPLASLSISGLVWIFVLIQRNPNFSRTIRGTSWAYLALAALCVWRIWFLVRHT